MKRINILCQTLATVLALVGGGTIASAQSLLYRFDETGTTAANRGSEGDMYALTLYEPNGSPSDLHSEKGDGVLGGEDRALDLSSAAQMGGSAKSPGSGPIAVNPMAGRLLNGAASFSLVGWYKTNSRADNSARLINVSGKLPVYLLLTGPLVLQIGNDTIASNSPAEGAVIRVEGKPLDYSRAEQWCFFALTYRYDSNANQSIATFYQKRANKLASYTVYYKPTTPTPQNCTGLFIGGNDKVNIRPFQGWLDEIAVYVSTTGSDGALDEETLRRLSER